MPFGGKGPMKMPLSEVQYAIKSLNKFSQIQIIDFSEILRYLFYILS